MNDLPAVISELAHKAADLAKPADDDQAGEAKPGHKPVAPKPGHQPAAPKTTDPAVPVALDLGWTMALLFRLAGRSQTAAARSDRLPTEHELPAGQRSELRAWAGQLADRPARRAAALACRASARAFAREPG